MSSDLDVFDSTDLSDEINDDEFDYEMNGVDRDRDAEDGITIKLDE